MDHHISSSDAAILCREADSAARRLVGKLGLPSHQIEDFRQDLLVDLVRRMPRFDPKRGSLGAFAGRLARNCATRIAIAVRRERALFGATPMALEERIAGENCLTHGDQVREEDGYGALFGQTTDLVVQADRRMSVAAGLSLVTESDRRLCAGLGQASVDELARRGLGARTSLYRQIKGIRLAFLAAGIEAT